MIRFPWNDLLPLLAIKRFHPIWNLQKACVIVTNQVTLFGSPREFCNTSNLVNSVWNLITVVYLEIIYGVSHLHFEWIRIVFRTVVHFQNQVKVGRHFAIFRVNWNRVFAEVTFRGISEFSNLIQNLSLWVIKTNLVINRRVGVKIWFSWEKSEKSAHNFEMLFGLEAIVPHLKTKFVQNQYISNSNSSWEILSIFSIKKDWTLVVGMARINYL